MGARGQGDGAMKPVCGALPAFPMIAVAGVLTAKVRRQE